MHSAMWLLWYLRHRILQWFQIVLYNLKLLLEVDNLAEKTSWEGEKKVAIEGKLQVGQDWSGETETNTYFG